MELSIKVKNNNQPFQVKMDDFILTKAVRETTSTSNIISLNEGNSNRVKAIALQTEGLDIKNRDSLRESNQSKLIVCEEIKRSILGIQNQTSSYIEEFKFSEPIFGNFTKSAYATHTNAGYTPKPHVVYEIGAKSFVEHFYVTDNEGKRQQGKSSVMNELLQVSGAEADQSLIWVIATTLDMLNKHSLVWLSGTRELVAIKKSSLTQVTEGLKRTTTFDISNYVVLDDDISDKSDFVLVKFIRAIMTKKAHNAYIILDVGGLDKRTYESLLILANNLLANCFVTIHNSLTGNMPNYVNAPIIDLPILAPNVKNAI